jgi:hypothetical protein
MITLALSAVTPALANPPDIVTVPISGSFVLAECDGFDVIDDYSGWATVKNFYDNDGNWLTSTRHVITFDRVYNSVTGFDVYYNYAVNQTFDPAINEYFIRGMAFNIIVPGYGIVYFDSGLGIFLFVDGQFVTVQFSGHYQADPDLLCEAMNQ